MAAKKPSTKATKAKKAPAKKHEVAKKSAAKKPVAPVRAKSAASSRAAPAKSKPVAKLVKAVKNAASVASSKVSAATESAKRALKPHAKPAPAKVEAKAEASTAKVEPKSAAKAPSQPAAPKAIVPASSVIQNQNDADAAAEEEADGPELSSTNLLAGPRNVKPYIPRRGEQYMGKEQLDHFRQILESWKRDLMEEVDRTVLHMKDEAANFPDPNDRATQESEFSLELRTRDRERKLIRKIDEAIKRIEDGTYGYCNETGEEIGIKRLEARPVATLCIEAQERRERREKQYGDRDDRYR